MATKYRIGDRVEDTESHRAGTIVHLYEEKGLRSVVAVAFDDHPSTPLAVHVADIRKLQPPKRT